MNIPKALLVGVASALGVAIVKVASSAVVALVTALGFTSSGITAGSIAAYMMSVLGGGSTAAGSLVAALQSIGAVGSLSLMGATIILKFFGCIGLAGGVLIYCINYVIQQLF